MEEQIEYIDTNEALEILNKSETIIRRYTPNRPTLIAWLKKYNLGKKYASRYFVDKDKLMYFIKRGNMDGYKKKEA